MMAPKRQDLSKSRNPRRDPRKRSGISQYILVVVALVVVATAATIMLSSGKKTAKPKASAVEDGAPGARRVMAGTIEAKARKAEARRAKKREKREKRPRRKKRAKTERRGSRVSAGRAGQSVPRQLQMIVTGAQGQRLAVIDSRQYKAGDEVEGRRVADIKSNEVVVEYRGKSYTVRVGQSLLQ